MVNLSNGSWPQEVITVGSSSVAEPGPEVRVVQSAFGPEKFAVRQAGQVPIDRHHRTGLTGSSGLQIHGDPIRHLSGHSGRWFSSWQVFSHGHTPGGQQKPPDRVAGLSQSGLLWWWLSRPARPPASSQGSLALSTTSVASHSLTMSDHGFALFLASPERKTLNGMDLAL